MHALKRCSPVLGLVILMLLPSGAAWSVTAEVGQQAPQFSLPSIHSNADLIQLADYRGKVVYLDFWSAWCAPCRRTIPELNALRDELSRDQFEVISVNIDAITADGRRLLEQSPVGHPVAADAAGLASARYGVKTIPAGFLIDRAGVVRKVVTGPAAEDIGQLRSSVSLLIQGDAIR